MRNHATLGRGASSEYKPAWAWLAQTFFALQIFSTLGSLVREAAVGRPWVESRELDWQPPARVPA